MEQKVKKTDEKSVELKKRTFEELEQENEQLKQQLANVPTDFESRLEYFKRQESNLKKLTNINLLIDELKGMMDKIYENVNELDHSTFSVVVIGSGSSNYDREKIKISDINVVAGMTEHIMGLLEQKREILKGALCA